MKISLNWIKKYGAGYEWSDDVTAIGVEALVEKIGAQLGAIEEVIDVGSKYQGVVIVKVVTCEQHPNADRLSVCTIDDGGITPDVKRGEHGHVQVVCGAPNVRAGLTVAWLPPGSTVPETVGKEPFVLGARELRGVVSNGMLASPKELALGDSHEGILEIEDDYVAGSDFAEVFNLKDDIVLDIENKMFTHRPDCFGWMGVARELAGIQHMPFQSPEWYGIDFALRAFAEGDLRPQGSELPLEIRNEIPELVPRFAAVTMHSVKVGLSPVWLQVELAKVGSRSINNIVDLTNYWMLVTGQPLHAYDYDKVRAQDQGADHATIVVRQPHESEQISLLNGKTITPRREAIVIASDSRLIGLGGVMGGADTEVDENTTNIILEAANFDMYSIRRTSMAHGLFTDAVTRFTKGQSPLQPAVVLAQIANSVQVSADGTVAGPLHDDKHLEMLPAYCTDYERYRPVQVTSSFINARLGLDLSHDEIMSLLTNVEFRHDDHEGKNELKVVAPFWRTDIEVAEDIVEEVGRLYGYDKLPLELPRRRLTPTRRDYELDLKATLRERLARTGANEVLTYSFVHDNLLQKTGQTAEQAFKLSNALRPDLQYYRLSLQPSLLEKVQPNLKAGYDQLAIFEIGKAHGVSEVDEDGLPHEPGRVALVFAADTKTVKRDYKGAPYYQARRYAFEAYDAFGLSRSISFRPVSEADPKFMEQALFTQLLGPFELERSALVYVGDRLAGVVGEYTAATRRALKLPAFCAGFELFLSGFDTSSVDTASHYVALPRFPAVTQDITLMVPADKPYQELFNFVWDELGKVQPPETLPTLGPRGIYQKPDDTGHKQITFRFTLASYERTLTDQAVNTMLDTVADLAHTSFGAERV